MNIKKRVSFLIFILLCGTFILLPACASAKSKYVTCTNSTFGIKAKAQIWVHYTRLNGNTVGIYQFDSKYTATGRGANIGNTAKVSLKAHWDNGQHQTMTARYKKWSSHRITWRFVSRGPAMARFQPTYYQGAKTASPVCKKWVHFN